MNVNKIYILHATRRMAILLSKFRIEYSDLVIISDLNEAPTNKTKIWFDNLIRPFLQSNINGIRQLIFTNYMF